MFLVALQLKVAGDATSIEGILQRTQMEALYSAVRRFAHITHPLYVEYLTRYPPETAANRPRNNPPYWWQRHVGLWRVVGRGRIDVGEMRTIPMRRIVLDERSQELGSSWRMYKRNRRRGVTIDLFTSVTYAPRVHHHREQAEFHKRRGWRTDVQAFNKWVNSRQFQDGIEVAFDSVFSSRRHRGLQNPLGAGYMAIPGLQYGPFLG